jgi:hypothetical protein
MPKSLALLLAATALLPGCAVYREATSATLPTDQSWRSVATDADRERMRNWRKAWDDALTPAQAADDGAIAREGALFAPDTALDKPDLPAGDYRCRTFKLGAKSEGLSAFTAYPWFACRVTPQGEVAAFEKRDGSQRPNGLLYAESETRNIFLGTLVLGDETQPLRYGLDNSRNMIGYVERVGERRWRLVLPYPTFESLLDVVELVPA